MKISGAIFDIDGTVTDSLWVWDGVAQKYLKKHGKTAEPNLEKTLLHKNTSQIGAYLKEHYFQDSPKTGDELVWELGKMGAMDYLLRVKLKPGVKPLLKQLHKNGVKMMVLTANDTRLVKAALIRNGVYRYFDVILCGSDPENAKDNPKAFENARKILGTPKEETFVFEDSLYAISTAKEAGFPVAAMYDSHEAQPEELKRISDFYVNDFNELLPNLEFGA